MRSLVGRGCAGTAEVGMGVVDACVDHRDLDALTVYTVGSGPNFWSADQRHAVHIGRRHQLQRPDRHDSGNGGELPRVTTADADLDAVVGDLIAGEHLPALRLDLCNDRSLLVLQLVLQLTLLVLRERGS